MGGGYKVRKLLLGVLILLNTFMLNEQLVNPLEAVPTASEFAVILFDRDMVQLGALNTEDIELTDIVALNGENRVLFTYPLDSVLGEEIGETFFVAVPDADLIWQLYEITELKKAINNTGDILKGEARHIYHELATEPILTKEFISVTANEAMDEALDGTRWKVGLYISGSATFSFVDYNPLQALRQIETEYDGELRFRVYVTGTGEVDYYVDLLPQLGRNTGLTYEFGHNIKGVEITYDSSGLVTALYGRGIGEELTSDGDVERLTFADEVWTIAGGDSADKPNGQEWVGDETAKTLYGKPDGSGGRKHIYGLYESQAVTGARLLTETWLQLQKNNAPTVNVAIDVADTEGISGFDHETARIGDTCNIKVPKIASAFSARIIRIERDRKNPLNTRVELGNFLAYDSDDIVELQTVSRTFQARQSIHDRAEIFEVAGNEVNEDYVIKNAIPGSDRDMFYYVDPVNGNDSNPGTLASPFKTINYALSLVPYQLNHQYLIQVSAGTVNEFVSLRNRTGTGLLIIRGADGVSPANHILLGQPDSGGTTNSLRCMEFIDVQPTIRVQGFTPLLSGGLAGASGYTFYSKDCKYVWYSNIQNTDSVTYNKYLFVAEGGFVRIYDCLASNAYAAVSAYGGAIVFSDTWSAAGSGNTNALLATEAATIGKQSTQPHGAETAFAGGEIR